MERVHLKIPSKIKLNKSFKLPLSNERNGMIVHSINNIPIPVEDNVVVPGHIPEGVAGTSKVQFKSPLQLI